MGNGKWDRILSTVNIVEWNKGCVEEVIIYIYLVYLMELYFNVCLFAKIVDYIIFYMYCTYSIYDSANQGL